jgi:hypothetical protein
MRSWQEQDNESQKEALAAFHRRERGNPYAGGWRIWKWLRDRWRWLRWFSWN